MLVKTSFVKKLFNYLATESGSSQNAGPGLGSEWGSGCHFFPILFVSIFVVILLCYYFQMFGIFSLFMVDIRKKKKKKRGTYESYERNIFVCFSKLREFFTDFGVFAGNIR